MSHHLAITTAMDAVLRAAEAGVGLSMRADGRLAARGGPAPLRAALASHGAAARTCWRLVEALAGGDDPGDVLLDALVQEARATPSHEAQCADCACLLRSGLCRAAYRLHLPGFGRGLRPGRALAHHDETVHVAGTRVLHQCPCHVPAADASALLAALLAAIAQHGGRWQVRQPAARPLTADERAAIARWLDAIGEADGLTRARVMARAEIDGVARDAALTLARARGGA